MFARPTSPDAPGGGVDHVAFDPTGAFLATTSADGVLRVWRASDGALVRSVSTQHHDGGVSWDGAWSHWRGLAWGRVLYAAGLAIQGAHWEQPLLRWPRAPEGPPEHVIARHVVEGGAGDTLLVNDDPDEGDVRWLVRPGHPGRVGPIVLPAGPHRRPRELTVVPRPQGILVETADDRLALATVAGLVEVPRPLSPAYACAAAANDRTLVVLRVTGEVWWSTDGEPWQRTGWTAGGDLFSEPACVAISPRGDRVAVGTRDRLTVLTLPVGQVAWERRFPRATDVRFDPDGRGVVAAFADGRVARWTPGEPPIWSDPPCPIEDSRWVVVDDRHAAGRRADGGWVVWELARGDVFRLGPGSGPPALQWPWAALRQPRQPGALEVVHLPKGVRTRVDFDGPIRRCSS